MARYALTVAYEGTDFHGWQHQIPPDVEPLRTVQGVLEHAVRQAVREPVDVVGASRTDAGVHANGQVAAFTCSDGAPAGRGWPASRGTTPLMRAINSRLPQDVLITDVRAVGDDFNPIADCTSKGYAYTIHVSPERPLIDRRRVTHIRTPLDVEIMREGAALLVGRHDFASFAAVGHGRRTTVRTIYACEVVQEAHPERIRIDISGNGFLYNMVRIIAGTLVEVGRGRRDASWVEAALAGADRRLAGPTLPGQGLCLEWVSYDAPSL